ncbi:MAG: hypothetical protein IJV22_04550 [Bacteroidales bacterium]|nr:hypothetical protein [Bacteroidales bacterium]
MNLRRTLRLTILALLPLLSACTRESQCKVSIGETAFTIRPNDALYRSLNTVGGYQYFTGGHRGVVIVRLYEDTFVAYDRTCPEDNDSQVSASDAGGWGSTLMECPTCHSRFNVYADGAPIDGSATSCSLFQYSTSYSGGELTVY